MPDRIARVWTGSEWEVITSNSPSPNAVAVYQSASPSGPVTGQVWINSNTNVVNVWSGSAWVGTSIDASNIASGTLGVARGGTGTTTSTGTGSVVLSNGPALAGTPTATTAAVGTNTTQIATTAYVKNETAYAQINKIAGQTMASGFDTILLDEIPVSKDISLVGNQIRFNLSGVYHINVGFRFGTASDAWTGVNLWNTSTGIVGQSFGTGNVVNDPGPAMFNFLANISNTSVNYSLRTFRGGANMAVVTPNTDAGRAFVVTIFKIS